MDRSLFTDASPGRLVRTRTRRGPNWLDDWAFIPDDLPIDLGLTAAIYAKLVDARAAIVRLDGIGRHLQSPNILLTPLQRREALRSSSLEGTYAEPADLLLFALEPREPSSTTDPVNAWLEVYNYMAALQAGQAALRDVELTRFRGHPNLINN